MAPADYIPYVVVETKNATDNSTAEIIKGGDEAATGTCSIFGNSTV